MFQKNKDKNARTSLSVTLALAIFSVLVLFVLVTVSGMMRRGGGTGEEEGRLVGGEEVVGMAHSIRHVGNSISKFWKKKSSCFNFDLLSLDCLASVSASFSIISHQLFHPVGNQWSNLAFFSAGFHSPGSLQSMLIPRMISSSFFGVHQVGHFSFFNLHQCPLLTQ